MMETSTSKKKRQKKKVSIHNESSDEESEEHEERLVRKPSTVEIDTQKAMKAKVPDEPSDKSAVSDEGTSTSLEVPNESKDKNISWKYTNDDESEDDDEEDKYDDDKSFKIIKSVDERMDTDVEDQDDEELKADEEQKGDDEARDEQLVVPKRDYKNVIEEFVHANVINEVKNFLPKFLPVAVKEALEKSPPSLGQSSSQSQSVIQVAESLSEYELKKILYEMMHKSQSYLTYDTHQELYDALTWLMILHEATMKKGNNPDKVPKKRDHEDDYDEDPLAGSNQGKKTKKRRVNESESSKKTSTTKESSKGKSPARTSKFGKSVTAKESVKEPVFEIASNDVEQNVNDKVGDVGQPPYTIADKTQADAAPRILKKDWFKEAPRPKILDLDWNTVKTVNDTPEQSWFNKMVQAKKHPLTFDELMSTPIDFSAFSMNHLKLYKITRAYLVCPVFNQLKGTCKSCVELEYNMEKYYRALTDQLDWPNPKGHKSPVDMRKPLHLQDKEGRLTIPVKLFFKNNLEYLKARNKERTYSSSITKTPAARYTMKRIEEMIMKLWTPVIIAYDKDFALGISH
nr:hypothetical protein [Tanacetum cinerariifolium]